jgi:hypothetical protein
MRTPTHVRRPCRAALVTLALAVAGLLAGCGGGDDGEYPVCSQAAQKGWLGDTMNDWYFWYRQSPRPNPAGFADVLDYYEALLYTGGTAEFPQADRWSRSESTASFNRFYGDGATLGYGVAVNGLEVAGLAGQPLLVRHVEPTSDAASKGVQRGDEIVSADGRSAADMIAANDFGALAASQVGQRLTLVLRNGGAVRTVVLVASVFALTPVSDVAVVASPNGRRIGYLMVKEMIGQAEAGIDSAFATFRAQGVQDLVVDLRYNGGGLVSVGATLASYIAGTRGSGRAYVDLLYNDKRSGNDQRFLFGNPQQALGLARVYLLTGPRTCSASEQVINGLRGIDVQVFTVGDTTCGKPFGSLPVSSCGTTYTAVNFESANARNEGRYWDGFDASCAVGEDLSRPIGALDDPLLVAAAHHIDNGACPAVAAAAAARRQRVLGLERPAWRRGLRLDERDVLLPR